MVEETCSWSDSEIRKMELKKRIRNLMWTVSGDYNLEIEPEWFDLERQKTLIFYDAVKQGAFVKYFEQKKLNRYLAQRVSRVADAELLLRVTGLCIDAVVFSFLRRERPGTEELRKKVFEELLKETQEKSEPDVLKQVERIFMQKALGKRQENEGALEEVLFVLNKILSLEYSKNTDEIIKSIDEIYTYIQQCDSTVKRDKQNSFLLLYGNKMAQDAWKECMTDEQMEEVMKKYITALKRRRFSFEMDQEKKISSSIGRLQKNKEEEINHKTVRKVREYVELNYGKSYLTDLEQERMNQELCKGIHERCKVYLTDGILQNPVIKNNQYRFSQLQYEKNKLYYGNHHWVIKKNIAILADMLKQALVLRNEEYTSRSETGQLVVNRLWKISRTKDKLLFDRKNRSSSSEFVVDILLDASGSQAKRQSEVAAQGYILSEALSIAGIPHRVSGYCAFWGYTVIQRFRDYEEGREGNDRIFQFRAYANNRDGLALKTIWNSLICRPEEKKIMIVLSDGKPCDINVKRPGLPQPLNYEGEEAVKDTAVEVRKARNNGISMLGIFTGSERDLLWERKIFGKDFAYIRNINSFSRVAGVFLKNQIDED